MLGVKMTYALAGKLAKGNFLYRLFGKNESVMRLRRLMHTLSQTYAEGADQIVAATLIAKRRLAQEGVSETTLHVMEGISRIDIPEELRACVKYSEMIGSYVAARGGGLNHEEALDALSGFFCGATHRARATG